MAHQRALRWLVSDLKTNHPEMYAKVQARLQEEEEEKKRAEEAEAVRREALRAASRRADEALICTGTPLPTSVRLKILSEFVAFRTWDIDRDGQLKGVGIGSHHRWREVNFADRVPTDHNDHGFYAIRIDPQGLIMGGTGNYLGRSRCCGLVGLGGQVVEHEDGWFRAEYARILCIWYVGNQMQAYVDVPWLYERYPTTPVIVCTQKQVIESLFAVAAASVAGLR